MSNLLNAISVIGSIASSLGLGIQMFGTDKNEKDTNAESDKVLELLIALSIKSKALKTVHTYYHNLYSDLNHINSYLKNPKEISIYKTYSEINRADLFIELSRSRLLTKASHDTDKLLSLPIAELKKSASTYSSTTIDEVRAFDTQIASAIESIIHHQDIILRLHERYVEFFKGIKVILDKEKIQKDDFNSIIKPNRPLLSSDFSSIINDTDKALMSYLDLYHIILESIKN